MSPLATKIKGFIRSRKLNVFLVFFLLAFFILILARLSATYTNTVKFNIELQSIPDEMVVLNDSSNTLDLTMTTYGFQWLKYYYKTPTLAINFRKNIKKSDSLYFWSLSRGFPGINKQFGKDITVKSINPDTLIFKVDINAVKMVPVKPNVKLKFSPGYNMLDAIVAIPDSVKIIGPESLLLNIHYLETELLEKQEVNKPFSSQLQLKLDSLNTQIQVKTKLVKLEIKSEKFTEGTISLPVNIINIPKNTEVNYFPKNINLSYYTSLENYNAVKITDFEVICDFNKRNSKSAYITPKLVKYPKGLKSTRLHQQKIEYIISE